MRFSPAVVLLIMIALAAPATAGHGRAGKRPRLDLRASPRLALVPVSVFAIAELVGGDEVEDFYCPTVEWDWGDGARSAHESDCPPFERGMAMARRHSASHAYRRPGEYSVRVTLSRVGRPLAAATALVSVR
ncbi:MAG TPA: PKD domain-containing protein [Vicinamibacteria bacterium]